MPNGVQDDGPERLDRIWFTRCPVPAASGVAWALGWLTEDFAQDGIDVAWMREDALHLVQPGAGGQGRMLFREGGNIPALAARALGAPTRVIGLTWIDERQAIMVRPGSQIFEPADLKGLRVALPGYSATRGRSILRGMSLHGVKNALAIAGLGLGDVTFVDVPAPPVDFAAPETLARMWSGLEWVADGRLDAVYVKGAAAAEAAAGLGLVVGVDLDVYPSRMTRINNGTPRPITVHEYMIEEHFDLVVRFLDQTLRAADWAATNLPALRRILAQETLAGPAGVMSAYRNDFHRSLHPDTSADRVGMLRSQADFLHLHGFLESAVDVDSWIDPRPLDAALALRAARKAA